MVTTKAYAAQSATSPLAPYTFQRRQPGDYDVLIEIQYCGVCHSDLHQSRDEWGIALYPMVPGHEIVGRVSQVGSKVSRFKVGDIAGVGCLVDSCRQCQSCTQGLEQFCEQGFVPTYSGYETDGVTLTQGGYADCIVVDENYVLQIEPSLPIAAVAPLLCAGITTYSPLKHWQAGPGKKVAVIGLGGLGHMALKIAAAMGAEVTLFTTSQAKAIDGKRLGAQQVVLTSDEEAMQASAQSQDLILNTVSAPIDLNPYLQVLRREGTLVCLGIPERPLDINIINLVMQRRCIAGSLIGSIAETQEMLDFCAQHKIVADIEIIHITDINHCFERLLNADVKYRFVIDMSTL